MFSQSLSLKPGVFKNRQKQSNQKPMNLHLTSNIQGLFLGEFVSGATGWVSRGLGETTGKLSLFSSYWKQNMSKSYN